MKEPVSLYLRIRTANGAWTYARAATKSNGRINPFYAWVNGRAQHHPEGVYQLRYIESGKRKWEPVKGDHTLAEVALKNKVAELAKAALKAKDEPATEAAPAVTVQEEAKQRKTIPTDTEFVRDAVSKYLDKVADRVGKNGYGAAPKTLQAYKRRLSFLLEFDGTTPINEVDESYFERLRHFLRERLDSDRYVYNVLQAVNIFFRTRGVNSCAKVLKESGYAPKEVRAYTPEQLNQFFAACTPEDDLLFKFLLHSMVREREAINTEVADLLSSESILWIRPKPHRKFRLKGKRSGQAVRGRKVPLPPAFMERLVAFSNGKQPHDLLFPNPNGKVQGHMLRRCKRVAKRAGLNTDEWNLHRFRKTAATLMYKGGMPVPTISAILGHESLAVTQLYLDISSAASAETVSFVASGPCAAWVGLSRGVA